MNACPECGRAVGAELNCPGCGKVLVPFRFGADDASGIPTAPPAFTPSPTPQGRPIATMAPPPRPPSVPRSYAPVPRRRHTGRWFVMVVLLLGMAAGSWAVTRSDHHARSSRPTASQPARETMWSGDPCTLLPQRDAAALFGAAAVSGGLPVPPTVPYCAWTARSTPAASLLFCKCIVHSLVLTVYPDYGTIWRDLSPRLQVVSRRDLTGIGDHAQLATMDHSDLELVFVKNGTSVLLTYSASSYQPPHINAAEQQDQLIAMAHNVANAM